MSVEFTQPVTRNHLVKWVSNGVIGDAGPQVAGQRILGVLQNADFNSTNDQPIIVPSSRIALIAAVARAPALRLFAALR